MFVGGTDKYAKVTGTITVYFRDGKVGCTNCPYYSIDKIGRYKCLITEEFIYSTDIVGTDCPFKSYVELGF